MTTELICHLGDFRTGSTAIQSVLRGQADRFGLFWPDGASHVALAQSLADAEARDHHGRYRLDARWRGKPRTCISARGMSNSPNSRPAGPDAEEKASARCPRSGPRRLMSGPAWAGPCSGRLCGLLVQDRQFFDGPSRAPYLELGSQTRVGRLSLCRRRFRPLARVPCGDAVSVLVVFYDRAIHLPGHGSVVAAISLAERHLAPILRVRCAVPQGHKTTQPGLVRSGLLWRCRLSPRDRRVLPRDGAGPRARWTIGRHHVPALMVRSV